MVWNTFICVQIIILKLVVKYDIYIGSLNIKMRSTFLIRWENIPTELYVKLSSENWSSALNSAKSVYCTNMFLLFTGAGHADDVSTTFYSPAIYPVYLPSETDKKVIRLVSKLFSNFFETG